MIPVHYPPPSFKIEQRAGVDHIFDTLRKKWVVLTPEEWVRQNFISFLQQEAGYPAALIAVEKQLTVGELTRRFDILVYNKMHQPWMMIECKSMDVALDESVFSQVLRYNAGIPVSYLVITNGTACMAWKREHGQLHPIDQWPPAE